MAQQLAVTVGWCHSAHRTGSVCLNADQRTTCCSPLTYFLCQISHSTVLDMHAEYMKLYSVLHWVATAPSLPLYSAHVLTSGDTKRSTDTQSYPSLAASADASELPPTSADAWDAFALQQGLDPADLADLAYQQGRFAAQAAHQAYMQQTALGAPAAAVSGSQHGTPGYPYMQQQQVSGVAATSCGCSGFLQFNTVRQVCWAIGALELLRQPCCASMAHRNDNC
jgi:hypothetical protein